MKEHSTQTGVHMSKKHLGELNGKRTSQAHARSGDLIEPATKGRAIKKADPKQSAILRQSSYTSSDGSNIFAVDPNFGLQIESRKEPFHHIGTRCAATIQIVRDHLRSDIHRACQVASRPPAFSEFVFDDFQELLFDNHLHAPNCHKAESIFKPRIDSGYSRFWTTVTAITDWSFTI